MKNLSASKFIVLISLINITVYYFPFYEYVFSNLDIFSLHGLLTFFSVLVSILTVTLSILFLVAIMSSKALKIFSIFILVGNSIAIYFILTYNVILDRTMMGNVINTNFDEIISYYHPRIFIYLFFLGIVPAYIISKIHIDKPKRKYLILQLISTLITGVFLMYLNANTWLWLDKHAKRLGALALPWSYTINTVRYTVKHLHNSKKQKLLPDAKFTNNDKMIFLLVIGESAREKNFSLYGYHKKTNPYLEKLNVIALKHATSTSTYTTASINSMFSSTGSTLNSYEVLPSYLQRQGVEVIWLANNSGAPPMRVQTYQKSRDLRSSCKGEKCNYDEILLTELEERINATKKKKILIVLHISGSHGPTYYKNYPKAFEVFKPVCKTVNLKECTKEELINAYDNTIVYTDYFLSKTINILKKNQNIPSVMLYVSDHGESLGEYGLYLHGTPYAIAPDVQKNIPMILWFSESFKEKKLQSSNIKEKESYSHKNIFHTVLGAFGMQSSIYNKNLDILQKE